MQALSGWWQAGATLWLWASHCGGFSCCGAWALGLVGFRSYSSQAVEHRLSSCGTWLSCCLVWGLPRPGIQPVSPALTSGFRTPGPPGKSVCLCLKLVSPRDFEKGTLKGFILPNVASWNEEKAIWALKHSVLLWFCWVWELFCLSSEKGAQGLFLPPSRSDVKARMT